MRADWQYSGQLHSVIRRADRILVRDGGDDWPEIVDAYPVLFEVRDPDEIAILQKHIRFHRNQCATVCGCRGYPVIDWYAGDARIALTSLQHGTAIRWDGFAGDASLTGESAQFIVEWLLRNGVSKAKLELK